MKGIQTLFRYIHWFLIPFTLLICFYFPSLGVKGPKLLPLWSILFSPYSTEHPICRKQFGTSAEPKECLDIVTYYSVEPNYTSILNLQKMATIRQKCSIPCHSQNLYNLNEILQSTEQITFWEILSHSLVQLLNNFSFGISARCERHSITKWHSD